MGTSYSFDSMNSLIEWLNSDKCKDGDVVSFNTIDVNGNVVKYLGYITSLDLTPIPQLLAPVEPIDRPFPDIEIRNQRWFEKFDREESKRNYINKANPKKGSVNYETQRIRNTKQAVHRQYRCQER